MRAAWFFGLSSSSIASLVAILVASTTTRLAHAQVNVEALRKDLDHDDITGSVATSLAGRAGNTQGLTAGLDGQIVGVSRPHSAFLVGKAEYTALNGDVQTAKTFLHLRYAYEARTDVLWGELFGQLQQDRFQRLQLRTLAGAGPRIRALRTEHLSIYVGAAVMLEHEEIAVADGASDASAHTDVRFSYVLTLLYKTSDPGVLLSSTLYVQPRAGDFDWYRVLSESAIDLVAGTHLGVKLSCMFHYDSRPPTEVKTIDLEVKNSLTWSF